MASYIYDVPFLKTSSNPVLKYVVAGWQVAGVTTIQSGTPVNVTLSGDPANIGVGEQRPNLVGPAPSLDCQPTANSRELVNCYDAAAFAVPAPFTFGNAPRNVLRGPKSNTTDLSLMKNIPLGGDRAVPVPRGDLQHVQHRQLRQPERRAERRIFGRISSAGACGRFSWAERFLLNPRPGEMGVGHGLAPDSPALEEEHAEQTHEESF